MLMIHCTVYDQEKLKLSTSNKGDFLRNFPSFSFILVIISRFWGERRVGLAQHVLKQCETIILLYCFPVKLSGSVT